MHGRLCRLRLLLSVQIGDERDVDKGEIGGADAELELPHGFDERCGFDVANGSSELDYTYVWNFAGLVYGDFGDAFDPILDRVCDVWDDLGMCFIRGRRYNEAEVVPALSCPDILLFAVGYESQSRVHGLQKRTRMWLRNASGRVDMITS